MNHNNVDMFELLHKVLKESNRLHWGYSVEDFDKELFNAEELYVLTLCNKGLN